jgi:hypothetical protein
MLIAILILNGLLALMGFAIAWQLWRWRDALATAADALWEAERVTHEVLNEAPTAIDGGQLAAQRLHQSHRQLAAQTRQIQSVLGLVGWSRQLIRHPAFRRRAIRPLP